MTHITVAIDMDDLADSVNAPKITAHMLNTIGRNLSMKEVSDLAENLNDHGRGLVLALAKEVARSEEAGAIESTPIG